MEASKSPVLADYIYENSIPKPCKFFCGRDTELEELHTAITTHKHVFLHGIAGIGKSELAKAYASKYKKEYTNILYLVYSGNLITDITEMDFADTKPSISNLSVMLDYITENIFKLPGIDITYYKTLFSVIENIIISTDKDDTPKYLTFIEDAFNCMDKYSYISGMNLIVTEMESVLADNTTDNVSDQILLLDYKATLSVLNDNNIKTAIHYEKKALSLLPALNDSTALLTSNIYANMGSLYRMDGQLELASSFMEKGISILETYNLIHMNESIAQICNYATLLQELNQPDIAISALRKCARLIKSATSDATLDYARAKETEGYIHLAIGELPLAQKCLKTAITIYENTWNDEGMIEDKYKEIAEA